MTAIPEDDVIENAAKRACVRFWNASMFDVDASWDKTPEAERNAWRAAVREAWLEFLKSGGVPA